LRFNVKGFALAALLSNPTLGTANPVTLRQAQFFVGTCFNSIDDLSRVASMAKSLSWETMPEDMENVGKPLQGQGYASLNISK
jgi:hypothetical protein